MLPEEDTSIEAELRRDPLAFYRRKPRIQEDAMPSTAVLVVGGTVAFGLLVAVLGAIVWLCLHKDTTVKPFIARHTGVALQAQGSDKNLPHYLSNDQKLRLTEATVVSEDPQKIVVSANNETTTVLIDDQTQIARRGTALPIDQYQQLMNSYAQQIQFAKPGVLYIPPEPFTRVPASLDAIHLDDALVIIPTPDSPDGDTAKAASILIDK